MHNPWDDAEEKAYMAYELYENDQMPQALEHLSEAIEINPDNPALHFNTGLTLDSMNCYEGAIDAYKQALKLSPDDPEILNSLAVDYTRLGRYDLAITTFEHLQSIDPNFEPSYCNRIITYAEMDMHEKAEQMFYLAQQINPDCPVCFYNMGNSLFTRQMYKRAIWCWERTALLEPAHPQINYRIAQAHWANGNNQQARFYFLQELRNNPGDTDVILDFGIFLLKRGDLENAREKFNRILELDPDFAPALFYLGELALAQNDIAQAKKFYERAQRRDLQLPGPRYRLGQIAFDTQDFQTATQLLKTECSLDIADTDVLLSMGSTLLKLDEVDYATDCFLRILDEEYENLDAFIGLAGALAIREEYEGAVQFYEHAIELGCKNPDVLADAATLYLKEGHLTTAAWVLAKAHKLKKTGKKIARIAIHIRLRIFKRSLQRKLENLGLHRITMFAARCKYYARKLINHLKKNDI